LTLDVVYPGQPAMFAVMPDGLLCSVVGDGRRVRIALLTADDIKCINKYVKET
jgi:hypothetical protein